jgi:hypothetical protein
MTCGVRAEISAPAIGSVTVRPVVGGERPVSVGGAAREIVDDGPDVGRHVHQGFGAVLLGRSPACGVRHNLGGR